MKHKYAYREKDTPRRLMTAAEAAETHRPGDRYRDGKDRLLRLHLPRVEGAPREHFEIEPRWE